MYMGLVTILSKIDSAQQSLPMDTNNFYKSIWFWLATFEFIALVFIVLRIKGKARVFKDPINKDVKAAQTAIVDMDNLMNSFSGSRDLYKELARVCHPDRFINTEKHKLAEEIFKEVSKYQRDFGKLTKLKERINEELNTNI